MAQDADAPGLAERDTAEDEKRKQRRRVAAEQ